MIKGWISERTYSDQLRAKTVHDLVNFSSNWWATLNLKDIFILSSWFIISNMAMTFERCYRTVVFEWMLEGCTHQDWLWDHLFWSSNAHFTAWIWVMNIVDDAKSFLFISWFDKPRGIHWEEHRECNKEPFTASYERHVWTTWQFPRRLMITYLKGMFQLEASSWRIDHLDGCWHDVHNQSEDNSQKNPGEKILHDESSNTTLGGRVELDKQQEQ